MHAQLRQLTEKIYLERPNSDLSFWRSTYLELQGPKTDHLIECYCALIETLLGIKTQRLKPCATKAGMPLLSWSAHPMCTVGQALEIADLWQWLGTLRSDEELQIAGARAKKFIDQLKSYPGLWSLESEENHRLQPQRFQPFDLSLNQMPDLQDPELGLCVHHDHGLQFAFTGVGRNSGFGSIRREDVGILSLGPSLWPNPDFGLMLSPTDLNNLVDHQPLPGYHVGQHGEALHYAVWSRFIDQNQHLWCELSAFCRQDMHLALRFLELKNTKISMLMAVKAEALKIGHQIELASRSLKQYKGVAKTVTLEGKSSQMVIIPSEQGKMEVIPLAGDDKYWGADFLLIYPFETYAPHLEWNIY